MSHASRTVALLLATGCLAAQAQVFKCTQPGGATVYQARPCPVPGTPAAHPTAAQLNAAQQAAAPQAQADDAYATPVKARPRAPGPQAPSVAEPPRKPLTRDNYSEEDRRKACTIALSNQVVLARGRQVFTYDANGNKQYIPETDRAAAQTRAQQSQAANCK